MKKSSKHAFIAGASRGLGLALTAEFLERGWNVTGTVRTPFPPPEALTRLSVRFPEQLLIEQLDQTKLKEILALQGRLSEDRYDLILANGGMKTRLVNANMLEVADDEFQTLVMTNVIGPIRILESLAVLARPGAVLAAMSSLLGSMEENPVGTWPAYASSKAALNMLLHEFAARLGDKHAVLAMAPGWVRTEMGGPEASLSIEESIPRTADVLVQAIGQPGLRFMNYDGRELRW